MIQLRNITKTVRSGTEDLTILADVSIDIPGGQFVALTGASGSGKSTLLGLIAGLDEPSSGTIIVDGDDITAMNEDGLARLRSEKIGFIFQSFHLIPSLTAFENILIPMEIAGARDARERAVKLLADVDLTDRGHHYPSELSGGEQQRVAIARAFANNPKILLADEPTGNLDSKNGQHIFELMTNLHDQNAVTLVLVTHDAALASQAQRQVILRDGRI
ncbi:MAG TPA: ABC transporter ATP-binding protein, partial [Pyrinomonadaceae bacterium]|nr:ABC transporter ATP-binding protein [Pyrinomonadaceae bacterium]